MLYKSKLRQEHRSIGNFPVGVVLEVSSLLTNLPSVSGCGAVGRAVAFKTRGPRFDSSHRQNFIGHLFIINCIERTKIN